MFKYYVLKWFKSILPFQYERKLNSSLSAYIKENYSGKMCQQNMIVQPVRLISVYPMVPKYCFPNTYSVVQKVCITLSLHFCLLTLKVTFMCFRVFVPAF